MHIWSHLMSTMDKRDENSTRTTSPETGTKNEKTRDIETELLLERSQHVCSYVIRMMANKQNVKKYAE